MGFDDITIGEHLSTINLVRDKLKEQRIELAE